VGKAIVDHPDVAAVSFTGSTETGLAVYSQAARRGAKVTCELGGKNAVIALADADVDAVVGSVMNGAFGSTGQRCTATSRLLLHRKIHDRFLRRLVEAANALRLGDGLDGRTDVGPLIHEAARQKVERYVRIGQEQGAELVCGGRRGTGARLGKGWFYRPTVFAGVRPSHRIAQEEIFGPVLSVIRFSGFEEAVRINNGVKYGLSSSLYTRNVNLAFQAMQRLDNGITYVNAPTIGAEAHLPFGGVKQTGNGHREGGWEVYEFYSETKVCYVDYSGTLQRAQIDNYQG
jgi:aldehyde dehydrogenase (NAD+)